MNIGFQLYQLQQIDSRIDLLSTRNNDISKIISENKEILKAELDVTLTEKKYIQSKNRFEELNSEIQSKKNKKAQSEASLYGGSVKNPKELQDLQQEISSLSNIIAKQDEDLLAQLVDLDRVENDLSEAKQNLKNKRTNFDTKKSLLVAENKNNLKEIQTLNSKRDSLVSGIDKNSYEKYMHIREQRNGIAVVVIADGSCAGCGTSLTASQQQKARSAAELFYCPSCRRIIYGS